ncbi:BrnA antitoxin family protein [Ciceribacter ferrooxidans]|uniref:BrnA antitoxin of type II toxin-antitoxin system n=1 Tax=Ciceribacter ferrooxidans TaxID=2509717 RepID=A0A4Q2T4U0_9HYPH|nr:BrnA antitoxin family protein [Ciceribacter ferrooxidans]RYC11974.1 hypothetical protein EUU22_12980 [Ciceribacter ferrooxidans]
MSKERIIKLTAEDVDKLLSAGADRTDWKRVDAMTDEDIVAAMRDDPDWQDLIDIDWSKAVAVTPPQKTAISIRLDEDIVDFFKATGKGYQTRINAVLRHFVTEQKRSKR